jgi:hypothetical protein
VVLSAQLNIPEESDIASARIRQIGDKPSVSGLGIALTSFAGGLVFPLLQRRLHQQYG